MEVRYGSDFSRCWKCIHEGLNHRMNAKRGCQWLGDLDSSDCMVPKSRLLA